jgi:hypothetical protein
MSCRCSCNRNCPGTTRNDPGSTNGSARREVPPTGGEINLDLKTEPQNASYGEGPNDGQRRWAMDTSVDPIAWRSRTSKVPIQAVLADLTLGGGQAEKPDHSG